MIKQTMSATSFLITIPRSVFNKLQELDSHPISQIIFNGKFPVDKRSFSQKIEELKVISDQFFPKESLWIKNLKFRNDTFLAFAMRQGFFKSTTHHESYYVGEGNEGRQTYYYFSIYANDELNDPMLELRVDQWGQIGELTTLEKRENLLHGNQLQTIADLIFQYLGTSRSELYDASGMALDLECDKKNQAPELRLKEFTAVASDDSTTFYGKSGYKVAEFYKVKPFDYVDNPRLMTQSAPHYYAALNALRNTRLGYAYTTIFKAMENARRQTKYLFDTYLKAKFQSKEITFSAKQAADWFSNATVHNLAKELLAASKSGLNRPKVHLDLYQFQQIFLNFYAYNGRVSQALSDFNLAIEIIRNHIIFTKDFSTIPPNETPPSFNSLIPIKKFGAVRWEDVIEGQLKPHLKRQGSQLDSKTESESSAKKAKVDPK